MGASEVRQTSGAIRPGVTLFERYRVERNLDGEADFRETRGRPVWLAYDTELDRDVVLKLFSGSGRVDGDFLEELKREMRRNLDLAHPHIARTFDFLSDGERAALAMEYVDGDSLAVLRAEEPQKMLKPEELELWLVQVCDALEYAHTKAGVVHRELNPEKILIDRDGDAKLIGFGTARSRDEESSVTPIDHEANTFYMSPEYARGDSPAVTDDVFSLGVVLYELISGHRPFPDGYFDIGSGDQFRVPRMTDRRGGGHIRGRKPVPERWESLVAKCLAPRAEDRFSSAGEIAAALRAGIEAAAPEAPAEPVGSERAAPSEPLWKKASRRAKARGGKKFRSKATPYLSGSGNVRRGLPTRLIARVAVLVALVGLVAGALFYVSEVRGPESAAAALAAQAAAAMGENDFAAARGFAERIRAEYPETGPGKNVATLFDSISGLEAQAMKGELRGMMAEIRGLIGGGKIDEAAVSIRGLDRYAAWEESGEIAALRADFESAKAESDAALIVARIKEGLGKIEGAVNDRATVPGDEEMARIESDLLSLELTFGRTSAAKEKAALEARLAEAEGEKRAWKIVDEVEKYVAQGEKREAAVSLARLDAYGGAAALGEKARLKAAIDALDE